MTGARILCTAVLSALVLAGVAGVPRVAEAQTYRFPTSSADYSEFYVTAYRDHASGGGLEDWNCGTDTYNGHGGTDYGVGSFPGMAAGRDVLAAADGVVAYVHDGEFDMCTSGTCSGGGGFGNYVKIDHPDGKSTYYGHLAQWSVAVSTGDTVSCGTYLGLVGSSGNSTGPHLHFEPRVSGSGVEPYAGSCSSSPGYWTVQGPYQSLPTMDCDGTPPPACTVGATAPCGSTAGTLNGGGSSDVVNSYACNSWSYVGPEYAYELVMPTTEPVTVTLTGLSEDLDLLVLDGAGCDPSTCFVSSDNPNTMGESVTFEAVAGNPYAIVVDGFEGVTSDFQISLTCPKMPPPPPPPPDMLPALSMAVEIASIPEQENDFAPDGASLGVFDLYERQGATVRFYVVNDAGAAGPAENVVLGLVVEEPYLGLYDVDVYTNDPSAGCGAEWCLEVDVAAAELIPNGDGVVMIPLGDVAVDRAKMAAVVVAGSAASPQEAHASVGAFVAHVDGVYERAALDAPATVNEGQTWNGGDLSGVEVLDVWPWTGEGLPPNAIDPLDTGTPIIVTGSCGCTVLGRNNTPPGALLLAPLFLLLFAGRARSSASPRR